MTVATDADQSNGQRDQVLLQVEGVSKRFGGVVALREASLRVAPGQVHALAGANGAGKSTLLKILAGLVRPDSGSLTMLGRPIHIHHPSDATRLGLNFIHQELNLVPNFTVLQNLTLGHPQAGRNGFVDWRAMRARGADVLNRLRVTLDLDEPVNRLSTHQRWIVTLGHALMRDAKIVAMDEPTASFAEAEVKHLFEIIRELTSTGHSIIYVSHRLDEILEITEEVTVLRDGQVVGTWPTSQVDRVTLTNYIVGHEVSEIVPPTIARRQPRPVLTLDGITREPRVRNVSIACNEGEIVGLAGLVGSGRTELAQIMFGVDRPTAGTMTLDGRQYRPRSPYDAIEQGVALIPEERRRQGLVLQESVEFNISLATNASNKLKSWLPFVSMGKKRVAALDMIAKLGIKTPSPGERVADLSGGNQQKVVVSKSLRANPRVLILDEPTAGVDVGARDDIYTLIKQLAAAGTAVVLISSEFEELQLCHRVVVLREGTVTHLVDSARISKETLTRLCYEVPAAS